MEKLRTCLCDCVNVKIKNDTQVWGPFIASVKCMDLIDDVEDE